jgi:Amt family ammonium transporter
MGMLGTFILAFGWFGFNAGSTLAAADTQIGVIATNTMLASAAGAISAMCLTRKAFDYFEPTFMCNGMLAGLVAITAPCAFVDSWAAVLIGASAGVIMYYSASFFERKEIDDPVGAISVHGTCGLFGVLALGLFANGRYGEGWNKVPGKVTGLFYGDLSQFIAELVGGIACITFVFFAASLVFKAIGSFCPHRSTIRDEDEGLDKTEMGGKAYL